MIPSDSDTGIGGGAYRFPTTRRSAVVRAGSDDPAERERALDLLLAVYWKPAYKHLRLHWRCGNDEAKDLTQGFFAHALAKDVLAGYEPSRGTFRTFLRTCLDRFVANERKAAGRIKRGGGTPAVSLDFAAAEAELAQASPSASPEEQFHREWVRSLFALAVEALERECRAEGKDEQFALFEAYDLDPAEGERPTYAELAARTALPVTTITNHLAAARRRFRRILLQSLREATASDAEFRAEARRLVGKDPE